MSWKEQLERELAAATRCFKTRGTVPSLRVECEAGVLQADLAAADQLACAVTRFSFVADRLVGSSIERLRAIADDLSRRLNYLLEPIQLLEADEQRQIVLMRSCPPQKDDDATRYYELLVRSGELVLSRYAGRPRQPRVVVPAQVTREVFFRLADDLVHAVRQ